MREFELRRGQFKKIGGSTGIKSLMKEIFGNVNEMGGAFVSSYGALKSITVKVISTDKITVETETDPKVPMDIASDTMKKYNQFMERTTGFTASERAKRLQQKAKNGKL